MAGTKRSASPAPAASKRRASAQGTISDAFAGPKKGGRAAKTSSSTKAKARQLTPDASSDDDRPPAKAYSTPVKKAVDPTTAYPTPSKTPAKALKAAVKDIGILTVEESDEEGAEQGDVGKKAKPDRLNVKDKKWDKAYWAARGKMGGMEPSASLASSGRIDTADEARRSPRRGPEPDRPDPSRL